MIKLSLIYGSELALDTVTLSPIFSVLHKNLLVFIGELRKICDLQNNQEKGRKKNMKKRTLCFAIVDSFFYRTHAASLSEQKKSGNKSSIVK